MKYIGDIQPEDFTQPECYEVVQKYFKKYKTKIKTLQKQVTRLQNKIINFKQLLSELHKKGSLSSNAVEDLKVSVYI